MRKKEEIYLKMEEKYRITRVVSRDKEKESDQSHSKLITYNKTDKNYKTLNPQIIKNKK